MRSPVVVLPAEQYFADTAAKMSPGRTLPPRYARCSSSGVRARAFSSGRPNVLRDIDERKALLHQDLEQTSRY